MKTKDIKEIPIGTEIAAIPVHSIQQGSGILQHGIEKAKLLEVYPEARRAEHGRWGQEKVIARIQVEDGTTYEVAPRRIFGTWTQLEEAERLSAIAQKRHRAEQAERLRKATARAEALNGAQIAAGLVDEAGEPLVTYRVDEMRGTVREAYNAKVATLIERACKTIIQQEERTAA
jgi:hypothetical protein